MDKNDFVTYLCRRLRNLLEIVDSDPEYNEYNDAYAHCLRQVLSMIDEIDKSDK